MADLWASISRATSAWRSRLTYIYGIGVPAPREYWKRTAIDRNLRAPRTYRRQVTAAARLHRRQPQGGG